MSQQSFRQVFVTNSTALLAQGSTVDSLAVGQIGILDAKTKTAVTAPTYATTKAFEIVLGTPDLGDLPLLAGIPNANIYSKLIKGKKIKGFRGKASKRPQTQIVSVGFSGDVSDTNTLFAKPGESRKLYVDLSGSAIDKLYSKQGITRIYGYEAPVADDCSDSCVNVDPRDIADSLVKQINADIKINRYVKASKIQSCTPTLTPDASQPIFVFELRVCDAKNETALGLVQAAYPSLKVTRSGFDGNVSIYQIQSTTNSAPSAFSNAGTVVIQGCAVCPSGYTHVPTGFVYQILRQDAGTSGALVTLKSDYGISSTGESATRLAYEFGQSTYVVVSATAISSPVGTDVVNSEGVSRDYCVITSPTTISWTAGSILYEYAKTFTITLGDTVCGVNRLAELQAFYPDLVVTIVNAGGTCVHTYQTSVYSNPVQLGCNVNELFWTAPQGFDGVQWVTSGESALPDGTTCLVGVQIEVAYVNRLTNECTFDHFPYEADTVHLKLSTFDPNYNDSPNRDEWVVKQLRSVQYPAGFGASIQKLEKQSLSYELRERSFDPVVREIEKYQFNAKTYNYYDEYVLDFEFEYFVGGWSDKYTDSYSVSVFFPEGGGKAFETAINSYLASATIQDDPVVL